MTKGVVFVRRANMWQFYIHLNNGNTNVVEWFSTKEEAEERLRKEDNV